MESITHGLIGVTLSALGARQKFGWAGLVIFVTASLIPDIEGIFFWGSLKYLKYHRGISHSVLAVPFFALLLAFLFYLFRTPVKFGYIYLLSLSAMYFHIFFDVINSYGTQILYPLSRKWYAWDLNIIVDPYITIPFLVGTILVFVFPRFSRWTAVLCLLAGLVNLGLRARRHLTALQLLGQRTGSAENLFVLPRVENLPDVFSLNRWTGIEEKEEFYYVYKIDTEKQEVAEPEILISAGKVKIPPSEEVKYFLYWSRFPYIETKEEGKQQIITYNDVRFMGKRGRFFRVEMRIDKKLI